jgi:hypothetical protein
MLDKLPEPFVRNVIEKSTNVEIDQFTFFRRSPTNKASNASCWLRPGRNP